MTTAAPCHPAGRPPIRRPSGRTIGRSIELPRRGRWTRSWPLGATFAAAASAMETAASAAISTPGAALVPDGELIVLRLKPSPWMMLSGVWIPLLAGTAFLLDVLGLGVEVGRGVATRLPVLGWTWGQSLSRLGGAVVFACILVIAWRFFEWLAATYVLTDRRIIVRVGVLNQTTVDAPLRRIQHVALHRTVEQRALALGTLTFSTAGVGGEFAWAMISRPEERLRIVRETIERYARNGGDV